MQTKQKAILYILFTALLWSTGGVLIKLVDWNPMSLAGARSVIAALIIGIAFRHERLTFSKEQWLGAIAYSGCVIFFVTATKLTTAANAILLQYTSPVFVALFASWLLGEKASRRDWITIFFVLGGMIFFFLDKVSTGGMLGNISAIFAGITFALFAVFMRLQKNGSPYGSILIGNLLTFAISLPFWPGNSLAATNLVGILLLGIFQLGMAYVLYSFAIRHIPALEATLIGSIEPILNPIWVACFIGETPGFYSIIGGIIVLCAITFRYWSDYKNHCREITPQT